MPSKAITDAFVRKVKLPRPDDKPNQVSYIHTLERGLALVLVVSYGGTKTFRCMTYVNGKAQSRKLGTYPRMGVKEARAKAREYWLNPQKFEEQAEAGTVKDVCMAWVKRYVDENGLISKPEIERCLRVYVYSRVGDMKFLEFRRKEVNALLDHIADHHSRGVADAVLAILRQICNWYVTRSETYISPIVKGMRRGKPVRRDRILSDDEIRKLWHEADGVYGAILKVLLLTGQRETKVATMRWDNLKGGTWTIRNGNAREKGHAGVLKLPPMAFDIIEGQPRIAGNDFVFATGSQRSFCTWDASKKALDAKLKFDVPWRVHDLRRSARSLLSRADVRPDVAERVLGHVIGGVAGIYDRHHYDLEKADALKQLAALIETILRPPSDNVVALGRRT
jgi:integrase